MSLTLPVSRENIVDYAELVVRDFLQSRGYLEALEALTSEAAAAKLERKGSQEQDGKDAPERSEEDSVESWYIVNQHLGLPTLLGENRTTGKKYGLF